tara:strand:- start:433 stop:864 length:432 start_codon:yes stop_codon:yes gene_type:complete
MGATGGEVVPLDQCVVSIHAPVMGATVVQQADAVFCQRFDPRTRDGCDLSQRIKGSKNYQVSIHAPVMGATRGNCRVQPVQRVSIHAPVMGATFSVKKARTLFSVSIHAPVMGATRAPPDLVRKTACFDPRTRDGCDRVILSC